MTIQHNLITDPNIHEPKGVSSAAIGKVYVADGAGSGDWVYPSGYVHGEIYIDEGATAQTLPAASAYAKLNPTGEWTQGVVKVIIASPSTGEMTFPEAGDYKLCFWCRFSTASLASGTEYNFKYAIDGSTSSRTLSASKISNGSDKLLVNAVGIASVTAGQVLSMYVGGDATSSSTDITILEAGLSAIKL